MPDSATPLLQLTDQENGGNDNTWGDIEDANNLRLEGAIAGQTAKSLSGGTITLTDDEAVSAMIAFTGGLGSNSIVQVPTRTKVWLVTNDTTGAYTVTMKTASGTGYVLPRGRARWVFCDGANVQAVDAAGSVPIGGMLHLAAASLGLDDVDFLATNGALVSRTGYATLFAKISTTFGVGDGSTTFTLPDTRERYTRGAGTTNAVGTYLADELKSHTHTGETSADGEHLHNYTGFNTTTVGSGSGGTGVSSSTKTTAENGFHVHDMTTDATGGTETRPATITALGIIRYQ